MATELTSSNYARLCERISGNEKLRKQARKDDKDALEKALTTAQLAIDKAETSFNERLQGFPQLYATKPEVENVKEAQLKLRSEMIQTAVYEAQHQILEDRVSRIEALGLKLSGGLFVVGLIGVTNLIRIWVG